MAEGVLAPPEVLVRYLAIFRRVFAEMEASAAADDLARMWLCQWAADALHNVPGMLTDYEVKPDDWNSPERLSEWMDVFPRSFAECGGPDESVVRCRELFRREGAHIELGLSKDLSDLDLAPRPQIDKLLRFLYLTCLDTRNRVSWRRFGGGREMAVRDLARRNGLIGGVAKEIPVAIVKWHSFDKEAFYTGWQAMAGQLDHMPDYIQLVLATQGRELKET